MTNEHTETRFPLGNTFATPGAIEALERANESAAQYLSRHQRGDWGTLTLADKRANEESLINGARVLSAYHTEAGDKLWVITEADRSATTILLPSEY